MFGRRLVEGRPVRGGVPVCWPWFAKQDRPPDAIQHGFVRRMRWRVVTCAERPDGRVRVLMQVAAPPEGWPGGLGWPADCAPELEVLVGDALELSLRTVNRGDAPVTLTQALHTYFRVGDVRRIGIAGLQGLRYLDKLRDFGEFAQEAAWSFDSACDRIYLRSGARHRIDDPVLERSIAIESERSSSTRGLEPRRGGHRRARRRAGRGLVPVRLRRAANCAPLDRVTLGPGEETTLLQRISAVALGG